MRNQFFDPGFLYIDRGSIGTRSAHSNVSRAGLGKFRSKPDKVPFLRCLITRYRKIRKLRETIFGSLVVGWVLY